MFSKDRKISRIIEQMSIGAMPWHVGCTKLRKLDVNLGDIVEQFHEHTMSYGTAVRRLVTEGRNLPGGPLSRLQAEGMLQPSLGR